MFRLPVKTTNKIFNDSCGVLAAQMISKKLRLLRQRGYYVRMHACMYGRADGRMDAGMDRSKLYAYMHGKSAVLS